jgi:hypothetical protein
MSDPTPSRDHEAQAAFSDPLVQELLAARLIGVLATLRPGGAIDAVPMWYAAGRRRCDPRDVSRSRKVRNIESDPRATLVLHDSRPGYEVCGASITGTIEVVRSPKAQDLVGLVHARYLLADAGAIREWRRTSSRTTWRCGSRRPPR